MILRAFSQAVLDRAPSLYLPLDFDLRDEAGEEVASSISLKNGAALGGSPMLRGCVDGSVVLDGANDHVFVGYTPWQAGTARSFICLANRASSTNNDTFFGGDASQAPFAWLASGTQHVIWQPRNGAGSATTWANIWPGNGKDVFVGIVFDDQANLASLYLDGEFVSTQAQVNSFLGNGNLLVGAMLVGGTETFHGALSHFALFERALAAEDFAALQAARTEERFDAATGSYVPKWPDSDVVTFTPKAGLPASLDGSLGIPPLGEYVDLGNLVDAGSLTTSNPDLQSMLRATDFFDEA